MQEKERAEKTYNKIMALAQTQEEDLHTPASHFEILSEQFKNARIDRLEEVLTEKINSTRNELTQKINSLDTKLTEQIKGTNDRINSLDEKLTEKINSTNERIKSTRNELIEKINSTKNELSGQIKSLFWIQGATIALLISIIAKLFIT